MQTCVYSSPGRSTVGKLCGWRLVGILLRFERQRFAVAQRFAVFAVRCRRRSCRCRTAWQAGRSAPRSCGPKRVPRPGRRLDAVRVRSRPWCGRSPRRCAAARCRRRCARRWRAAGGSRGVPVTSAISPVGISTESTGVVWLALMVNDVVEDRAVTLALEVEEGVVRRFTTVGLSVVAL